MFGKSPWLVTQTGGSESVRAALNIHLAVVTLSLSVGKGRAISAEKLFLVKFLTSNAEGVFGDRFRLTVGVSAL